MKEATLIEISAVITIKTQNRLNAVDSQSCKHPVSINMPIHASSGIF